MKKSGLIILFLCFFNLVACGNHSATKTPAAHAKNVPPTTYLYHNQTNGISIKQIAGWTKDDKLSSSEPRDPVFSNGKLKVIVTTAAAKDSFTEIKNNLKAASPDAKIIKEQSAFLSYKTANKESIETDVYLQKKNSKNYIIIFMMPVSDAVGNQQKMKDFISNTTF